MTVTIERIETAGRDSRARRLFLSDHSEPRLTTASLVRHLHLQEGDVIVPEDLAATLGELEPAFARERALRFLGYRERSSREVFRRLVDDGYPSDVATRVLQRLEELGLVDDDRFAHAWARSRVGAGLGPKRIARELKDRGIDSDLAESALAEALGGDDPIERARAVLGKRSPADRRERDRMLQRLVRRGFDLSTAIKALDPAAADSTAPDSGDESLHLDDNRP